MTTISFDTETRGLEWFNPDHRAFIATWSYEDGRPTGLAHLDDPVETQQFLDAIAEADTLVAHNLPFDVHHVREATGRDLLTTGQRLIDTALLSRVVVPERGVGEKDTEGDTTGFGLKNLAATYVDPEAKDAEDEMKVLAKAAGIKLKETGGYYDFWRAYPDVLESYAKVDTELTIALYRKLEAKLTADLLDVWAIEEAAQPWLIRAEQRGVALDQVHVAPLKVEFERKAAGALAIVESELGLDAESITKPDALREALLEHGVPLYRKTDTGQIATHKGSLGEFEKDFPALAALSEYRNAAKFLSTYIGPMLGRDVVHPTFWQLGAWTSRMSCSRPNMQNIPVRAGSEVREMFVPRPGYAFVVADFDSIELRLLAYYLHDEGFKRRIDAGADVFSELAAFLAETRGYGAEHGTTPDCFRKGTPGEKFRGAAKNTTYAVTYGAGGAKIGDMLGTEPGDPYPADHFMVQRGFAKAGDPMHAEARAIIKTIKSWLPGYQDLTRRIRKKVETTAHVNTIHGRRQPVGRDKAYVGLNALIQGSAAEIMKKAIIAAGPRMLPLDAHMVLFVHDEIVVECPAAQAEQVKDVLEHAMNNCFQLDPPLAVSGAIAHNSYAEGK